MTENATVPLVTKPPELSPRLNDDDRRALRRRRRSMRQRFLWLPLLGLTLLAVFEFRRPLFQGNFGVIDPGTAFRSAQPRKELADTIRRHALKSVLNLRGGAYDDDWYADEVQVTAANSVAFYDFPMNASRRPTRYELLTLLDFFERCEYPVLIHCKSGSDRTGLATSLYLMARKNVGPDAALRAFSLEYGHVPIGGPESLHEPIVEYAEWLESHHVRHDPKQLRRWVEQDYKSADPPGPARPLVPGPRKTLADGGDAERIAR